MRLEEVFDRKIPWDKRVQSVCFEIIGLILQASVQKKWKYLSSKIHQTLRNARFLHSKERWFVGELSYGIIRFYKRILFLIEDKKKLQAPIIYWVYLIEQLFLFSEDTYHKNYNFFQEMFQLCGIDLEEIIFREKKIQQKLLSIDVTEEELSIYYSYPPWLIYSFIKQYGKSKAIELLRIQNQRAPMIIRVNQLKTNRLEVKKELEKGGIFVENTRHAKNGLILHTQQNIYALDLFKKGWIEIQDEGSQLIVELVSAKEGEIIIDACAGAGGKTLGLAGDMKNRGILWAMDIDQNKLQELKKRAKRTGVFNIRTYLLQNKEDKEDLKKFHGIARRVLCDVPCSGTGVIRRNPETRWQIQADDIEQLAQKQKKILEQFSLFVAQGGYLIYSTCSLLGEENEKVIDSFLENHSEYERVPISKILGEERSNLLESHEFLKTYPSSNGGDGFFATVLQKN